MVKNSVPRYNLDVLPFGRVWYDGPGAFNNAVGYASYHCRSYAPMIRVSHDAGNVIETHMQTDDGMKRRL